MKLLLLALLGITLYSSNDARFFISNQLNNVSEVIRPDPQIKVYH